jgi:hypothetical protein
MELEIEVVEVAAEVEVEVQIEVEIETEPIRVDTKLDVVETEAELGTKSRIHNLANCWGNPSYIDEVAFD